MITFNDVIKFNYVYKADRKGNKYSVSWIDRWMNHGYFAELCAKQFYGYELTLDTNTRFDEGSDLEEDRISVKSSRTTLTNVKLGYSKEEIIEKFFELDYSESYVWVQIEPGSTDFRIYHMSKEEFREMVEKFGSYEKDRRVIRMPRDTDKLQDWLNEKIK